MSTLLNCEGLDAGYTKGNPVVRGFDLQVQEGEVVTLLGPNGAGKTTVLLSLSGLLASLGGKVEVNGQSIKPGHPRATAKAGLVLVPDNRELFTSLTTEDNLRLAVAKRRDWPAAKDSIIGYFPSLEPRLKVQAGALSGGEQQMLAIGRALVQHPKVLLIDELSMGLAPVIVERLLPVMRQVADTTGTAIVLVEQHVQLALGVADTAVVLRHGAKVLEGPAADFVGRPELIESAYLGEQIAHSASADAG